MKTTKEILASGSLKQKCLRLGVDYEKVQNYRDRYDLADEQAIVHFRPELRINLLGQIILPDW